jgi:hypothetical protein
MSTDGATRQRRSSSVRVRNRQSDWSTAARARTREPAGHDMTCIISLSIPARSLCRCSKSSLVPSSPTEIKAGGTRTRFGSYSCYAKQSTRREGFVRRAGAGRSYSAPGASHKQLARPRATAAALATAGKATKDTVQQPRKRTAYTSTPSNSSRPIETRVRRAYWCKKASCCWSHRSYTNQRACMCRRRM